MVEDIGITEDYHWTNGGSGLFDIFRSGGEDGGPVKYTEKSVVCTLKKVCPGIRKIGLATEPNASSALTSLTLNVGQRLETDDGYLANLEVDGNSSGVGLISFDALFNQNGGVKAQLTSYESGSAAFLLVSFRGDENHGGVVSLEIVPEFQTESKHLARVIEKNAIPVTITR